MLSTKILTNNNKRIRNCLKKIIKKARWVIMEEPSSRHLIEAFKKVNTKIPEVDENDGFQRSCFDSSQNERSK